MDGVKVTIIMPVYNAARYLQKCIDSILSQIHSNWELICIDDSSTDESCRILKEYLDMDPRIKLYQQPHQNAGAARNKGMTYASGKYLLFLDADDFFCNDMLSEAVRTAEGTDADIVLYGAYTYHEKTMETAPADWILNHNYFPNSALFSWCDIPGHIFNISSCNPWNKLYNRDFIEANHIRFQEITRANDVYFTCKALVCANRISISDKQLIYYRIGNSSSLQGMDKGRSLHFYTALKSVKEFLQEKGYWHDQGIKQSFVNMSIDHCINELNDSKSFHSYQYLYQTLKDEIFPYLEISNQDKDYFYKEYLYEQYLHICDNSAEDCLLLEKSSYMQNMNSLVQQSINLDLVVKSTRIELLKKSWLFPYDQIRKGCSIAIYGAGDMGQDYYLQMMQTGYCTVRIWVDQLYEKFRCMGQDVSAPASLVNQEFDYVIIAIRNQEVIRYIYNNLISMNISENRIIIPKYD